MLKDGLYNKKVYMPKIELSDRLIKVNYTMHALQAARTDSHGYIALNDYIKPSDFELIEMEVRNSKIFKILIRKNYDESCDISMVILMDSLNVKTVWLNDKNDLHQTLNVARYMPAP